MVGRNTRSEMADDGVEAEMSGDVTDVELAWRVGDGKEKMTSRA